MNNGRVNVARSERLSLRLEKFKSASVPLPRSFTVSAPEGKMLGFLFTTNDEAANHNSLIIHLFHYHLHIPLPKLMLPFKYPVYRENLNDTLVTRRRRRWSYISVVRTYGLGYHFFEKSFYLLYGIQPGKERVCGKNKIKVWSPFSRGE